MTEDEERRSVTPPAGAGATSEPNVSPEDQSTSGSVPPDMPVPDASIGSADRPTGFDQHDASRPAETTLAVPGPPIGTAAKPDVVRPETEEMSSPPGVAAFPGSQPTRTSGVFPVLLGLLTLILLGAVSYLFYTMPDTGRLSATNDTLADLKSRVAALESHPTVPGLDALKQQIDASTRQLATLTSDLGAMKERVEALGSPAQGATGAGDVAPTMAALSGKVADLDQGLGAVKATLAQAKPDLSPITADIDGLQKHVAALETKVDSIPPVDLAPITARLDAVDGQLKPLVAEAQAAKSPDRVTAARENGSAAESRAAPLAVTAQAVLRAIESGRPFPADLNVLQSLGAEATSLSQLQAVAEAGAPTTQDLRADLAGLRDRLLAQSAPTPSGSYMDRLMAGAATLVRVRPLGSVVGDAPAAVLARMDDDLARDDLASALAEWQKLPDAARSIAKSLADRVRLRQSAEDAARLIGADAIKAMASAQQ